MNANTCAKCRHANHDGYRCLNMASDNDCACTSPVGLRPALSTPPADDDLTDDEYDAKYGLRGPLDSSYPARRTPPADDVREAAQTFAEGVGWVWEALTPMWQERFEQAARAVLVRPHGTVTDAEVEAATRAFYEADQVTDHDEVSGNSVPRPWASNSDRYQTHLRGLVRAALKAAREARS